MDPIDSGSLGESLLQWVRSFEGIAKAESSWKDLSDGRVLWEILQEVDDDYFAGVLPEPHVTPADDWTRRWQNLKHVEKQVSMYYRDICNGQEQVTAMPDLQAIAADFSAYDLERLIMLIIRAAMASPQGNQKMAQRLMSLGRERAMIIAGELRSIEEAEEYGPGEGRDESAYQSEQDGASDEPIPEAANGSKSNATGMYRDPLLEREEELLQAQAMIDKLQSNHAAAQRQLQELRQDKDSLQEAFDAFRDDIDSKGRKVGGEDAVRKLQRQADNDRAYIEDLETQLQSSRTSVENYERQISKHKEESEGSQKLRDDLQMLRAENEDLSQKIKANENLKKKIQVLQEQERTATTLREELKQANERLQELERLKAVQAGLEKEIIEKRGLIRNQEYQITELTTTRKHAEYDARVLAQKLDAARERHERDHESLEELRLKLREQNGEDNNAATSADELDAQMKATEAPTATAPSASKNVEAEHLTEKLALLEQQLEAADAQLKQANQRNADFQEKEREEAAGKERASQQIEDLESQTEALKKQLEEAANKPKDTTAPDAAALQHENRLMASAWFDLSARLSNNGVSLARRRQDPKSWIGKTRLLVGPNGGLQR